jgi:hypothetical protein
MIIVEVYYLNLSVKSRKAQRKNAPDFSSAFSEMFLTILTFWREKIVSIGVSLSDLTISSMNKHF